MLQAFLYRVFSEMLMRMVAWLLDVYNAVKVPWPSQGQQGLKFLLGQHRDLQFARLLEL
jgi:hypothetical protein